MQLRQFIDGDEPNILAIYQAAFAGFPWFEELSMATVQGRFAKDKQRLGFDCLVAEEDGQIVGACWWDETSPQLLRQERGERLANFCETHCGSNGLIWCRDTIVAPHLHGQGIASTLKQELFRRLKTAGKTFIFTRFRDDNLPIIKVNQRFGMRPTGVKTLVTTRDGSKTSGEFWYLNLAEIS